MNTLDIPRRIHDLGHLVGNTPLLEVHFTYRGRPRRIFAKAENLNMTGSIKDRMALHVLRRAYERGALAPGAPIAEATSGNTGISFAALGRAMGHPVTIFMPDWMSQERKDLIRSLGAAIRLVSKEEGGFLGSIRLSEELAASVPGSFLPCQFSNIDNVEAHRTTTGPEIWWQLQFQGLVPDAFVAGVGTGGTIMGVGACLREFHPAVKLHPLEPANSPTLSTGHKGILLVTANQIATSQVSMARETGRCENEKTGENMRESMQHQPMKSWKRAENTDRRLSQS